MQAFLQSLRASVSCIQIPGQQLFVPLPHDNKTTILKCNDLISCHPTADMGNKILCISVIIKIIQINHQSISLGVCTMMCICIIIRYM